MSTSFAKPPPPRQIRFVNTEGHPPPKRRRISSACRTCRKRKTRCDGGRPLCSTCGDNKIQCLGYADLDEGVVHTKEGNNPDSLYQNQEDLRQKQERSQRPETQRRTGDRRVGGNSKHRRTDSKLSSNSETGTTIRRDKCSASTDSTHGDVTNVSTDHRGSAVYPDNGFSSINSSPPLVSENRRVPFFRYFGPTAIVPGFKQMVVSVREHRRSTGSGSGVAMSPGRSTGTLDANSSSNSDFASLGGAETRVIVNMPEYDPDCTSPVHQLIIHLVETFFAHLGCNYPFLRQQEFTQQVEEKRVDGILVDALCALAARFSDHPLLVRFHSSSHPKSDYGNIFAQRAKAALVDHFPRPSVAATQACLLLAYESFGANQDSALWMYLGCAIRMAVDLGLQKLDGVRHQDHVNHRRSLDGAPPAEYQTTITAQEKQAVEQERTDTIWAVFMLDRVISSGTGRPVTLKDDDFELPFPKITPNVENGWPNPFPALIQIIHLYGRVSDLLNNIRSVQDVTPEKVEGLSGMENDLTQLYQRLDDRLTFNAANFQHYVKSGEGTNFILVHFWFHTVIMLLHQPQLMHSFEGQVLQLFSNSRELSMSSAKTIADILAFAELIDPKSFIGNPFTSQPMYIAACAFLMESAVHTSQPPSRERSPPDTTGPFVQEKSRTSRLKDYQKHSLLAVAANTNYQRCYKALQSLEQYWAGTRYILVALDQKAKGIWDPETYTEQEYESTKHDITPHWGGKLSVAAPSSSRLGELFPQKLQKVSGSPSIDTSNAIGWSLTGTTNSSSSNLTLMFQNSSDEQMRPQPSPPPRPAAGSMRYDPIRSSLPEATASNSAAAYPAQFQDSFKSRSHPLTKTALPTPKFLPLTPDSATKSEAEMLLELRSSPFAQTSGSYRSYDASQKLVSAGSRQEPSLPYDFMGSNMTSSPAYLGLDGASDMMMESQDIDMSTMSNDMVPWLEFLPQDVLNFFDSGNGTPGAGHAPMHESTD